MKESMNIQDKIKGALYGFAIGDAMGATTEFMTKDEIQSKYKKLEDIIGGGWLNIEAGNVTDDTEMSLCVMHVLIKNDYKNFKKDIACEFSKWLDTQPQDVGNQCMKAIEFYKNNNEYIYVDNTALGNGSLMRALPCALLNLKESEELNIIQGEVTHNNEICKNIIKEYTTTIKNILFNKEINFTKKELLDPSGYIINTYNNAIYWSNKLTFEECIIGAVNHGGDADTIAAISGSISGAKFGYTSIPEKWINQLNYNIKIKLDEFIEFVIQMY